MRDAAIVIMHGIDVQFNFVALAIHTGTFNLATPVSTGFQGFLNFFGKSFWVLVEVEEAGQGLLACFTSISTVGIVYRDETEFCIGDEYAFRNVLN